MVTLSRLIAACGFLLNWQLVPEPGIEDWATRALISLPVLDRLPAAMSRALAGLGPATRGLDLVVGGRSAARLQGADVRVHEIELWVDPRVDVDELTSYLAASGVEYVSPMGHCAPAFADRSTLVTGWPLVAPEADLHLRSVDAFSDVLHRSAPPEATGLQLASPQDCALLWAPRDLDHLALQRALRLLAERSQAI